MKRILIVDDEVNMQMVLSMLFEEAGYTTATAANGREALSLLCHGDEKIDLVISDLKMPDMNGLELLDHLAEKLIRVPVLMVTAYGTIEKAVEAMKKGAADFITKPFNKEMIMHTVSRVLRMEELERENVLLKEHKKESRLIYRSEAMKRITEIARKAAAATCPVLLTGESGVGKEVIAQMIHSCYAEPKGNLPFVSINCPAVPETLLESELFGYKKGAFTGAMKDFPGKVAMADGGTLFLDEIGDLPLAIQPKLLRLLESKSYEPLGSTFTKKADIRILCATNKDLKTLVRERTFREDLYYRINTITIEVPPLRERKADLEVLVEFFLTKYSADLGRGMPEISAAAREALTAYDWQGNVRELRNVIERAVVLCSGNRITPQDLPRELFDSERGPAGEDNKLEGMEKKLLKETLSRHEGNISAAARALGVTRNTLRYRLKKYDLVME